MALASKHRGAHVFGRADSAKLKQFHDLHIRYITLVPYASQRDVDSPDIRTTWRGEPDFRRQDSLWSARIRAVQRAGFRVHLKPHVWLHAPTEGRWRADIYPLTETDRQRWGTAYRAFILRYAVLAERNGVALFCIGAEFTRLTSEFPDYWRTLIAEVRAVYSGELTYAANWYEEYEQIDFWDALDYIGVQAYFPLSTQPTPSVEQLQAGWQPHLNALRAVAERHGRPILFTELGYKSTVDSAAEPWRWIDYERDTTGQLSLATQTHCYEAFFASVWPQPWLAGAHLWQFRGDYPARRSPYTQLDFTPQGKPAAAVIARGFAEQ